MKRPSLTIGVEEEFQIIDPETCGLRSHVSELMESSVPSLGDQIKREMHQSIVEVGTRICADVGELRHELIRIRAEILARRLRALQFAQGEPAAAPSRASA